MYLVIDSVLEFDQNWLKRGSHQENHVDRMISALNNEIMKLQYAQASESWDAQ